MARIQVWMEGFIIQGNSGGASLVGTYEASDFDDAVKQYNEDYKVDAHHLPADKRGDHWSIWGCRLYDNEADARRSFG